VSLRTRWDVLRRPLDLHGTTGGSMVGRGLLSMVGLAAQGALRFLTSFLVGRIAGKVTLGVFQSALSTGSLLALLWPTTTGAAASKFVARARGAEDPREVEVVAAHLTRRTVQSVAVLALAAVPVWMLFDGGTALAGLGVSLFVAAYSGYSFTRGVQFGSGQVLRATSWDVLSAGVGLVATAAALLAGLRGTALLLPLALSYGLYTLAGWPRGVHGRPAPALRRELDHFVALGVAGTVASTGFIQLSMIVARLTGGDAAAGQYAAALTTATPASMIALSLSLALFPSLAESWGRGDIAGFRARTDTAVRSLAAVMVALFGVLVVCSRLVMSIWGPEFDPSTPVYPVLLFAILATSLGVATVSALTTRSARGVTITTAASIGGMLVGLALWWVLTPGMGTLGVAVGYLVGAVCIAGVPFLVVWRLDRQRWVGPVLRVLLAVAVLVVVAVVQRRADVPVWSDPLVAVVFLGAWLGLDHRDARVVLDRLRGLVR
jgi:O-antigen/teichoic acid export membrane protein